MTERSTDDFETFSEYPDILSGAHRKPAPKVRPPVLVRNLCFWYPLSRPDDEELFKTIRRNRRKTIDAYLHKLYLYLTDETRAKEDPRYGISHFASSNSAAGVIRLLEMQIGADRRLHDRTDAWTSEQSQLIAFEFQWFGLLVSLRFELHAEYLALTSYVDFSTRKTFAELRLFLAGDKTPAGVKDAYAALRRLQRMIAKPEVDRAKYGELYTTLYFDFWKDFSKTILQSDCIEAKALGTVFTDFRGLVLGRPKAEAGGSREFQGPFWRDRGDRDPADGTRVAMHQSEWKAARVARWLQVREKFWPFLTCHVGGIEFRKYEFTVSQMLDGRALYFTALGTQPEVPEHDNRFPLCYFIYSDSLNGWQVGRLVDRINGLGTFRLAALIGLPKLREAGYVLRVVETRIQKAAQRVYRSIEATNEMVEMAKADGRLPLSSDELHQLLEEQQNSRRVEALRVDLAAIGKLVLRINSLSDGKAEAGIDATDELEYRIERSRFYRRQFQAGLPALRIRRLEGFQPYNAFVERRLGASFAFVESLFSRYESMRVDIAALHQTFLAQQAEAAQYATRSGNDRIARLQSIADGALWLALAPYYVGSLLFNDLLDWTGRERPWYTPFGWLAVWLSFGFFWANREFKLRKRLKRWLAGQDSNDLIFYVVVGSIALAAAITFLKAFWFHG